MCIICNEGFFDSIMLKQTSVLPFKFIKSCFFFNNKRIMPRRALKGRATVRGRGWLGFCSPRKF